jgi:hypothetical protein
MSPTRESRRRRRYVPCMETGGSSEAIERDRRTRERRFEIISTVILAFAALTTAWSGYQASLWDGIQSSDYTQASGMRTNAAQKHTEANQVRIADLLVFQGYLEAKAIGDERLAQFYQERYRDEFEVAFNAWIALDPLNNPDAPHSPLAVPEYEPAVEVEAQELTAEADAKFAEGQEANTYSDIFTLATVLFAAALFFAAISERFEFVPARVTLLLLATSGLIAGLAVSLSQPVTSG